MKTLLLTTILTATIFHAGCLNNANTSVTPNGNKTGNTNTNSVPNTNADTAATTGKTKSEGGPVGALATPTDTYETAYDCRKRKDIECLKRVMSQDILDFLKMMGEDEKKSLDVMLREICERPQAPTNESRNEKIAGNAATLEYPDESGTWRTMDFEKVGNEWHMTAPGGGPNPGDRPEKR